MSNYHQRVISLHYSEKDLPRFETDAEVRAWHEAVGRMVCYGLQREAQDDTVQLVSGGLSVKPLELCLTYYEPKMPERWEDGTRKIVNTPEGYLDDALIKLRQAASRSFTMAAVLHQDGKWGFHS